MLVFPPWARFQPIAFDGPPNDLLRRPKLWLTGTTLVTEMTPIAEKIATQAALVDAVAKWWIKGGLANAEAADGMIDFINPAIAKEVVAAVLTLVRRGKSQT